MEVVNPASFGDEGKTSLGEGLRVVGEWERGGRSKYEMSPGEVEVIIEKSRVEVLEEVVVEDVAEAPELVEEEVSARRRRARGIVLFEDSIESSMRVEVVEAFASRDWVCLWRRSCL